MELDRKTLLDRVTLLATACDKDSQPILGHIRFEDDDGTLTLSATNLQRQFVAKLPVTDSGPGSFCAPATGLLERLRALDSERIRIKTNDGSIQIKAVGSKRTFNLSVLSADSFPSVYTAPNSGGTTISAAKLLAAMDSVLYAVSRDTSRIHLNSLCLETGNLVATDGHRVALNRCEDLKLPAQVKLPLSTAESLRAALVSAKTSDVQLYYAGNRLYVTFPDFEFTGMTADVDYPPYQQVIPQRTQRSYTVVRQSLLSAVRAMSVASDRDSRMLAVEFCDETITVASDGSNSPAATDELSAVRISGRDGVRLGVSHRYLVDSLSSSKDETVTIETSGELDPLVIRSGESKLDVIMPMRL